MHVLSALLDLCPVPPTRRKGVHWTLAPARITWTLLHLTCMETGSRCQGWINTWIWSSHLQGWFAASPTSQSWRHSVTAAQPVSAYATPYNTQIQSFSPSAVFQVKRLQVWQLWNELSQKKPEKLNKERKQREMGMCCNVFSINLMWSVPLSKFSLCHRDLACKLAIVKGDVPWSLQDPEQCVGLTNFSCSPTCGSDWGMAQACSPYEISVS